MQSLLIIILLMLAVSDILRDHDQSSKPQIPVGLRWTRINDNF